MKIDKKNPKHIKALLISGTFSLLGASMRPILKLRKNKKKNIIFYGHTLNGNLKAFYDYLLEKKGYNPYFLVLDQAYYYTLKSSADYPETVLNALSLADMLKVAKADAFITSHGLHLLNPLRSFTNIKFIDVWHAVSYKGFGYKEFDHLRAHDEIWVSSEEMRIMYINRYGFEVAKVKVTGYGRTDLLVGNKLDKKAIVEKYSIPKAKKYVLIAPTWAQDSKGRSLVPFSVSQESFFTDLDDIARKNETQIIFRTHLNSGDSVNVPNLTHTSFMPYSKYPIVEDFLFISDILVTDWSSIGIDYLPLRRPAIFLDVPPPFNNGFNMGPEHRYGEVVSDFSKFKEMLEKCLKSPEYFQHIHKKEMDNSIEVGYGNTLDGKSLHRYFNNLEIILQSNK